MFFLYLGFLRWSGADHTLNCLKLSMLHWKIRKVKTQDLEVRLSHIPPALLWVGQRCPK